MTITLNDRPFSIENNSSLRSLIADQAMLERKGIAVAVNNTVIPKEDWSSHVIKENDQIIIITATQGG